MNKNIDNEFGATFRIEFIRPGVKYEFRYAKSVKAAIEAANSVQFLTDKPHRSNSEKPLEAHITQRLVNTWELIAKADATGVHPVLYYNRESYKRLTNHLKRLQQSMQAAKEACEEFHREVERVLLDKLHDKMQAEQFKGKSA